MPREEHKSPKVKRVGTGSPEKCTKVSVMQMQRAGLGAEKSTTKAHLADFSLQRKVGLGDRNSGKNFRDKKGAGDSEDMLRRPL